MGKDLVGRFTDLIQSGAFQLHLDSNTFPADTSIHFLQGDGFGTSPRTRFGCLEGFHLVSATSNANQDPLGCGRSTLVLGLLLLSCVRLQKRPQGSESACSGTESGESFTYLFNKSFQSSATHGQIAITH